VIGAYYYIMIVKLMYFDEPAPAFAATRDRVGGALILASALFVSPLGYLVWGSLDVATQAAAQSLF
jgi:NADH-quinone oxidoreductase subunit N